MSYVNICVWDISVFKLVNSDYYVVTSSNDNGYHDYTYCFILRNIWSTDDNYCKTFTSSIEPCQYRILSSVILDNVSVTQTVLYMIKSAQLADKKRGHYQVRYNIQILLCRHLNLNYDQQSSFIAILTDNPNTRLSVNKCWVASR